MWYQQLRTWSPTHDTMVWRLSVPNEMGHEVFALLVEDCPRREMRMRKQVAVEAIYDYMDAERSEGRIPEPCEVKIAPETMRAAVQRAMQERMAA